MQTNLKPAACTTIALLCAALLFATGCKDKAAPNATAPVPTPKSVLMDATARTNAAKGAQQHPDFKVFLQQIEMPTILAVAENTTDDQLKNLLWYLRTQVRSGKFKELGIKPTATLFDKPGYSSGEFNIYRGTRCAKEMYTTSGPDPCGASIHKSAAYHWGEGGDPWADSASIVTQAGTTDLLFNADDGWRTEEEVQKDPDGSLRKAADLRIKYATTQNAKQVRQGTDIRFYVDQPDDELGAVSSELATEAGQKTFLNQFVILERDHVCPLAFKSVKLGVRGSAGKSHPLDCTASK